MKLYVLAGRATLDCPNVAKGAGHRAGIDFRWQAGSEHVQHHRKELTCALCGEMLVFASGMDPWRQPTIEVAGTPHDPTYHNPEK